jgi:hypothetical protein
MKGIIKGLIICLIITFLIPTVALAISSYVIGIKNLNTSCDTPNGNLIRLSTWLFVNSSVSLGLVMTYCLLLVAFFCSLQYKWLILFILCFLMNWLFVFCWNIIGAIQLFKHSAECLQNAEPLWIIVIICLIFQWLSLIQICIIITISNKNDQSYSSVSSVNVNVVEI